MWSRDRAPPQSRSNEDTVATASPEKADLKVSAYDNVAGLLIAMLVMVGGAVLLLFIIWLTTVLTWGTPSVPVEFIEYEGRGDSKASQLRWVQESFGRDGDPQHERLLERALEYVYATDATPREIHADVRRSCSVDERGRAVIRLPGL